MIEFPTRNGRWGLCSRPSPGSGFYLRKDFGEAEVGILYLHKECRAGEIWILSTQRISRGRGSDIDLQKRCMGSCLNDNVLRKISAIVKTISALRSLFLQKLLGNNGWILADRQSSTIDGA